MRYNSSRLTNNNNINNNIYNNMRGVFGEEDALTRLINTQPKDYLSQVPRDNTKMQDELETRSYRDNKQNYTDLPTAVVSSYQKNFGMEAGDGYPGYDYNDPYRLPASPPNYGEVNNLYPYDDHPRRAENPRLESRGG